jgi:hypothetical protein
MKSEKGRSEPNRERRNRKDVHIDQYEVDRQHERSGGNRDRGKRGKRDEKGNVLVYHEEHDTSKGRGGKRRG